MEHKLLKLEIQQFIWDNTGQPVTKLALQKNPFPYVEWTDILNQIAARAKAKDKLPTWYAAKNILYPSKVSVEQTSSEIAAEYKAGLVSGSSLIDLTGGFGVDDYYFYKKIKKVVHCELNLELSAIVQHNFKILGIENAEVIPGDSLDTLHRKDTEWDFIYIDPSRRSDTKGKVFMLKDCLPNVPELLDIYFGYTSNIMVKTAPLLDISSGLAEIHSVKSIHIVAINNEVKELLWLLEKGFSGSPLLHSVNIAKDETQTFTVGYNNDDVAVLGMPQAYLYEPNSAIMKSGAFEAVSSHYNINKLHKHTHLYTNDALIDFPGRRFSILKVLLYQKAEIKQHIEGKKMNVSTRNFPLQPADIIKKWKINDGGDTYAFFVTNSNNEKTVLLCHKA